MMTDRIGFARWLLGLAAMALVAVAPATAAAQAFANPLSNSGASNGTSNGLTLPNGNSIMLPGANLPGGQNLTPQQLQSIMVYRARAVARQRPGAAGRAAIHPVWLRWKLDAALPGTTVRRHRSGGGATIRP